MLWWTHQLQTTIPYHADVYLYPEPTQVNPKQVHLLKTSSQKLPGNKTFPTCVKHASFFGISIPSRALTSGESDRKAVFFNKNGEQDTIRAADENNSQSISIQTHRVCP